MDPPLTLQQVLFPARDVTFAQVVENLSAPETGPAAADNLISNEDSYPRICDEIRRRVPNGGVYLGVGPDQNFTFIAHAKPVLAFILDYRRRNLLLHLLHKALFALSPDRISYLVRLLARRPAVLQPDPDPQALVTAFQQLPMDRALLEATVAEVAAQLRPLRLVRDGEWSALATIQAKLAGPGMHGRFLALPIYPEFGTLIRTTDHDGRFAHVLADEAYYQTVRAAQLGDRIFPITGDFADDVTLPRLARWLSHHRLRISLLYMSDVEFFLLRGGRFLAYVDNLAGLPWSPDACIARTSTREISHPARAKNDHSTTILKPVAPFLVAAKAGQIASADDLFAR